MTQYTVENDNGMQHIATNTNEPRLRVLTEDQIAKMSDGSFRHYKRKVNAWRESVHNHGTPEAIRTIDYLYHACGRR